LPAAANIHRRPLSIHSAATEPIIKGITNPLSEKVESISRRNARSECEWPTTRKRDEEEDDEEDEEEDEPLAEQILPTIEGENGFKFLLDLNFLTPNLIFQK
jgi:hypothetical protein